MASVYHEIYAHFIHLFSDPSCNKRIFVVPFLLTPSCCFSSFYQWCRCCSFSLMHSILCYHLRTKWFIFYYPTMLCQVQFSCIYRVAYDSRVRSNPWHGACLLDKEEGGTYRDSFKIRLFGKKVFHNLMSGSHPTKNDFMHSSIALWSSSTTFRCFSWISLLDSAPLFIDGSRTKIFALVKSQMYVDHLKSNFTGRTICFLW